MSTTPIVVIITRPRKKSERQDSTEIELLDNGPENESDADLLRRAADKLDATS
jgi:hypothetical protein